MFKIGVFLRDRSLSLLLARLSIRPTSNRVGNFWRRRNETRSASFVDGDDGKVVKNSERGGRRGLGRFIFTLRSIPELCTLAKRVSASRRGEESGALPPSLPLCGFKFFLSLQLALPGILSFSPSPLLSSLPFLPLQEPSFLVGRRHFGSFVCLTF